MSSVSIKNSPRRGQLMAIEPADDELLAAASAGDRAALERLLLLHCDRLSRRIAATLPGSARQAASVDDLLQQTLVQAIRDIHSLKTRSLSGFAAWLLAIADHRVQDFLRAEGRDKRHVAAQATMPVPGGTSSMLNLLDQLSDHGATPSGNAARHEAVHAVQVGMAGLPSAQREAIKLHDIDGRSLDETAAAMDRSPGAVRGLLQRARRSLRAALGRSSRWFPRK
jgi:RNA polymerase sigma-70 factor (ECF subfamily)